MKTAGVATFTALSVLVIAVTGLITGGILFGLHSLVLLSGDTVGLGEGLLRTLGVVAYVTIALFALAAGGLFVSTLTENAIAAMAATVSIAVFSALLDAVPQLVGDSPSVADRSLARLRRTAPHVDQLHRPHPMDNDPHRLRRGVPLPRMVTHHYQGHHQLT